MYCSPRAGDFFNWLPRAQSAIGTRQLTRLRRIFNIMKTNNKIHYLASTFLIASLALTAIGSGSNGEYPDSDDPLPAAQSYKISSEEQLFVEPNFLEFKDYIEHSIVGETGFLAIKTPPNKRHVVVSRMWIFVTAYSSTPDQTDDTPFITASGSHVRDGIIAANFLSIGTKVRFPTMYGDKIFVVEDRMNPRYTYRADIWMRTREEAKQFGLRNLSIEVIREI